MQSEESAVKSDSGSGGTAEPIPFTARVSFYPAEISRDSVVSAGPRPALRMLDVVALVVGIVVGAGIFRTPSLIAASAGSELALYIVWIAGAFVSLAGAMCYAELATAYPNAGGELHFLMRAYGSRLAFLFAWARLTVIPTGSVAVMAFIFGDYISEIFHLGAFSSSIYAVLIVIGLTAINVMGIRQGKRTQNILTAAEVLGVLIIIIAGLVFATPSESAPKPATWPSHAAWGLMMVFVLLTYGGWNDAAYMSAEIKSPQKNIPRALLAGIVIIAALYLLINVAFVRALGLAGMAESETVASDLMQLVAGNGGAQIISLLIAISAVTSANATMLMGARSNYALGRDFPLFAKLGRWNDATGAPVNALLVQSVIILALVSLGTATRKGFQTMVEYTAPVFWFFFLMTGISLFVLRKKEPAAFRPFRVPLYPFTPILFCGISAYLLYSSLVYTGIGALVGIIVLAIGAIVLWKQSRMKSFA